MSYRLTATGRKNTEAYVRELEAKRKEILDAGKDTADDTTLPSVEDIENDVNFIGLDDEGEYYNGWSVTDNNDADYPLLLKLGRDLVDITAQESLTESLIKASDAYYNGEAFMSDLEFDKKVEELKVMEEVSGIILSGSPTTYVGAAVEGVTLREVTHEQPALSLDKVKYKNVQDLKKWLGDKQGVISWKMDGMTLVITFDNGKLTSIVTRGNGYVGEDVTANAKYIDGIPQQISYTGHLVVRGEAVMTYDEFERVNAEAGGIYQNPRNLVPGTLRSGEAANRKISFYAFELVNPEPQAMFVEGISFNLVFQGDRLNWLETLGFNIVEKEYVTSGDILEKIEEWKENVKNLKFPTDGLVISYNDMMYGMTLGNSSHHFRHSIALKWTDETETTIIRDIEWSVGKTGIITPVAIFDPVKLGAGSTITRASLHNISIMKNMPNMERDGEKCICGKGSRAKVYLANMIIPQIAACTPCEEYLYNANREYDQRSEACRTCAAYYHEAKTACPCSYGECDCYDPEPLIPESCPVCGAETRIEEKNGVITLHCDNPKCAAHQIGNLMNTFSKDGLFVKGLGESQIEDLMRHGIVDATPQSFYDIARRWKEFEANPHRNESEPGYLAIKHLLAKDGWGIRKWNNLMDAIDASRNTTLQKFLYSLNIPLLGNDLSKKLSKYWNDDAKKILEIVSMPQPYFDKLASELKSIDGIGEEKANNVAEYFRHVAADMELFSNFVRLLGELNFPRVEVKPTNASLAGLTFVITGSVHEYKNRDEFTASVEARGGKVAGSVSAKTSFLVNNDFGSTSGKNAKAKELGIPIISEDEFISRFGK